MSNSHSNQLTNGLSNLPAPATRCDKSWLIKVPEMEPSKSFIGKVLQTVLSTPEERKLLKKLAQVEDDEAARILNDELDNLSEEAKIRTISQFEAKVEASQIEHRKVMFGLSEVSENRLASSVTSLFVLKNKQQQVLSKVKGDPELIQLSGQIVEALADKSADELFRLNTKPR